jgi:predicted transcriptional regulator
MKMVKITKVELHNLSSSPNIIGVIKYFEPTLAKMKDKKNKTKVASKFVLFAKCYQGNQIAQRDDVWRHYSTQEGD